MIHKPTTPKIYLPRDPSCVLDLDARDVRGSKIYDRSGKGNHGAITGAVKKPHNYGLPVLAFDGTDDHIDCGSDDSLNITDEITISAWMKQTSNMPHSGLCTKWGDDNDKRLYQLTINDGIPTFDVSNGAGTFALVTASSITNGVWYHIAGVYNKVNSKIYVNGVETVGAAGTFSMAVSDKPVILGNLRWELSHPFNGSIGEVKIYNRAFSASEMSKIFNKLRYLYGI